MATDRAVGRVSPAARARWAALGVGTGRSAIQVGRAADSPEVEAIGAALVVADPGAVEQAADGERKS